MGKSFLQRVADAPHLLVAFAHLYRRRKRLRPGIDGQTLEKFCADLDGNLKEISRQLLSGEYRFSPTLEKEVVLGGGKRKIISRSTVRDTLTQKALALVVEPAYDSLLPANCCAFRPRSSPNLKKALRYIVGHTRQGGYWIVKEDIQAYFESMDHEFLLSQLAAAFPPALFDLYASYLKAPRVINGQLLPRAKGLPVGSILANFLANLYLRPLDLAMLDSGARYLRYCDDLLAFAPDQKEAEKIRATITEITAERGLELNPEKSLLLPPTSRFVHLGYEFRDGRIRIGPHALAKFKSRIRKITLRNRRPHLAKKTTAEEWVRNTVREVIAQVNSEIRGQTLHNWVRYFSWCNDVEQFRDLDHWVRERVRAAATGGWRRSNYRLLPTATLQELGLHSLVGEYYRWKYRRRNRSLISAIASRDHREATLEYYRQRFWESGRGAYSFPPGADGQTMEDFLAQSAKNLQQIASDLSRGSYQFSPFLEFDKVKKGREDPRVICRASFRDTFAQRAVATVIERRFDRVLSDRAYAYRPRRTQYAAFGQVLRYIRQNPDYWVVKADFQRFLDCVDLDMMAQAVRDLFAHEPLLLDLHLKYLYNGRLRDGVLLPRLMGLPRGGILTPFLANLYLRPLDETMSQRGFQYLRYADDIFVFARSRQEAEEAHRVLGEETTKLKLELSQDKTYIVPPREEYECLGYRVRGREITVRPFAINRLKQRIRRITSRHKSSGLKLDALATAEGQEKIRRLISQVRRAYIYRHGSEWARHFCRATNDAQFRQLDAWIADRVRAAITGRWSGRNRRLLPSPLLRQLGLVSLTSRFWRWKHRVWHQSRAKTKPSV